MATKYIARLNGEIVGTRKSDRTYTHAIVVGQPLVGNYYHGKGKFETPSTATWCGRLDLAQKEAAKRRGYWGVVEIVPAETA